MEVWDKPGVKTPGLRPMEVAMSKYEPLQRFLEHASQRAHIPMTFAEIETVLGGKLPASSRRHRAWWSNNPTNNVMTYAWLNAGYETADVDLGAERLTFRRRHVPEGGGNASVQPSPTLTRQAAAPATPSEPAPVGDETDATVCRHPIFGLFRGMIAVEPGYDLTQPTIDPDWLKEKYGE